MDNQQGSKKQKLDTAASNLSSTTNQSRADQVLLLPSNPPSQHPYETYSINSSTDHRTSQHPDETDVSMNHSISYPIVRYPCPTNCPMDSLQSYSSNQHSYEAYHPMNHQIHHHSTGQHLGEIYMPTNLSIDSPADPYPNDTNYPSSEDQHQ